MPARPIQANGRPENRPMRRKVTESHKRPHNGQVPSLAVTG